MDAISPNREIIRRICILNGGTICYISCKKDHQYIDVLADVAKEKLNDFAKELMEWSGVNYHVYSIHDEPSLKYEHLHIDEQILPLET